MKNKVIKVLIIILLISGIGFGAYYFNAQQTSVNEEKIEISEATVKKGDIKIDFMADGYAELTAYNLSFSELGTVDKINVEVGDIVEAGDIIATIDSTDYERDIENAQNNLEEAILKLEKTKTQNEIERINNENKFKSLESAYLSLKDEYEKMLQLEDVYTAEELANKKNALENAKSTYEAELEIYNLNQNDIDTKLDNLNVEKAKLSLEISQEKLENTIVISPIDGEILAINNEVGELVRNEEVFAIVANKEDLIVQAQVSEVDLEQVEKGQKVEVEFEAFLNQKFTGEVTSIDPLATSDSSGIISYYVYIELHEGHEIIKDGMTATVSFILSERTNVITIPNKAVQIADKKQVVEVVSQDGNAEVREIKTGLTDGTNVEVIEGLDVGETVIIRK